MSYCFYSCLPLTLHLLCLNNWALVVILKQLQPEPKGHRSFLRLECSGFTLDPSLACLQLLSLPTHHGA